MRYSIRVLIFWVLAIILGVFIAQSKLGKPTQVSGIEIGNSEGKTLVGGPSDWIAIVGTESIVPDDINWEIELHTVLPKIDAGDGPPPKAANPELNKSDIAETAKNSDALRQRLLVAHIERKILYQWIKSYSDGFDHDNPVRYISCLSDVKEISEQVPEFFSGPLSKARLKSRLCELSLIDQYLHERILTSSIIPEIDVRNYYQTHLEEFKTSNRLIFRQILLPSEAAAAALRPYIDRINFEDVAKKHSIAPEAKEGGIVGPLRRDQLPTFFDSVFDMQIGEISGIVKSEYGFHIMMPVERLNASVVAYQEAKKLITKKLEAQKRGDLYLSWLKEAMNTIPVQSRNGENPQ